MTEKYPDVIKATPPKWLSGLLMLLLLFVNVAVAVAVAVAVC